MIITRETNKLFMYKIIISDDRGYRGNRGPTHFQKTRISRHSQVMARHTVRHTDT